jgi:hypothetical protein
MLDNRNSGKASLELDDDYDGNYEDTCIKIALHLVANFKALKEAASLTTNLAEGWVRNEISAENRSQQRTL